MAKETPEINPAGIRVSRKSETPLYTQIYEQFREMILNHRLRSGERLPATRNLATAIGVSRIIVSQAYEQLIMEGYLTGKPGAGTYVAEAIPDHLLHVGGKQAEKMDKFSNESDRLPIEPFQIGTPSLDQFPYKAWAQVAGSVLKDMKTFHLGYDDTLGYWPLRKAIASYLRVSRAVTCEAEQIIVVTGSQQGLNLVTAALLKKGDKVWMEDPGYHGARLAFKEAGIDMCPVPVEADGIDLAYAIKHYSSAKLAYITPSHQFPLGYTLSQEKRLQLLKWAGDNEKWVLEDDYDSEFRYEGRPLESLQGLDTHRRVIYSGTFSKVLFPGLRLAYLVAPTPRVLQAFRKIKRNQDRHAPVLEQATLARFMEEGYFLRHIRKMRLLYAGRQAILVDLLTASLGNYLRIERHPSGMHLLCWLPETIDVAKLKREAKEKKLEIPFVNDFTLKKKLPPAMVLGFTAFSKYKLKVGVEKLAECVRKSVRT